MWFCRGADFNVLAPIEIEMAFSYWIVSLNFSQKLYLWPCADSYFVCYYNFLVFGLVLIDGTLLVICRRFHFLEAGSRVV